MGRILPRPPPRDNRAFPQTPFARDLRLSGTFRVAEETLFENRQRSETMPEPTTPTPGNDDTAGFTWRRGRVIPWRELGFRQDTSGGPGGQHANRSATRFTLTWRPLVSPALREHEIELLRTEWESRLTATGILRIRSSDERSARRNRDRCLEILATTLRSALAPRRVRRPTRPTRASKRKRLDQKKQHSQKKEGRRAPRSDD